MTQQPGDATGRRFVIAVDVGTTAAKVTAFALGRDVGPGRAGESDATIGGNSLGIRTGNASGNVSGAVAQDVSEVEASREYPMTEPQPGWQVQDADEMVNAALDALAEVASRLEGGHVVGIGLTTAMHDLVGLDAALRPVTPLVTWADSRAVEQAAALRAGGVATARRSGTPTHAMAPLAKIRWFHDREPQVAASVRWWAGLKDVLVLALTGQLVTERSTASGTGMLSLVTGDWDPELVALSGARVDQLPPVHATTDVLPLGEAASHVTGLLVGTPVVLGPGDGPAGNVGVGALDPGVAGLSLGTSAALRMVVGSPALHDDALFCYALTDDAWVVGGALSNGGMVGRWASGVFLPSSAGSQSPDDHLMDLAAQAPAGSDGLVMVPYLVGERSPLWEPTIPGAYLGVQKHHMAAHFARAAIEGVGLQLAAVLDQLEQVHPVAQVRATGGAMRGRLWRDVVAACLDRPLVVESSSAGTGLGAAAVALLALGEADDLAGARALLVADAGSPALVTASAGDIDCYRAVRRRLGTTLAALQPLAAAMSPRTHG